MEFPLGSQIKPVSALGKVWVREGRFSNFKTQWDWGLGHWNWTICNPLSPFCSGNFPFASSSYSEANSYYPRRPIGRKASFSNSITKWDRGVWVPGAFKLHHLEPSKSMLFGNFPYYFIFILWGQFLLPQTANREKGEFVQFQKRMRQMGGGLSAWGIQTGPFAAQ